MNGKTLEAVTKHGQNLLAIFPNAREKDPVKLCKRLRRLERRAAELTTALCNGDGDAGEHEDHLDDILHAVVGLLRSGDIPVFINRDPRGYVFKIQDKWIHENAPRFHRDMGGYGIIAPDLTA